MTFGAPTLELKAENETGGLASDPPPPNWSLRFALLRR
jgi:hypothetical protein